jgi:phage shock protein A
MMAETIGTRVGRIIAGSVHALIDAVENTAPDMVMEQAIREIDTNRSPCRCVWS